MTIYAFRCTAAAHEIEAFYDLGSAPDSVPCPDHDAPARRLPSRGSFIAVPGGYAATHR